MEGNSPLMHKQSSTFDDDDDDNDGHGTDK
jgi:hypothetical protein